MKKIFWGLLLSFMLSHGARTAWDAAHTPPVPFDTIPSTIAAMTLEEKVGQLFLPRCPTWDVEEWTQRLQPAGYVLFARDFDGRTWEEVQGNLASYQAASKIPLLLAVDEEGGSVVRVSSNPNLASAPFPPQQSVYRDGGVEGLKQDASAKADLLLPLGLNVNLAPVCDISTDPANYIYSRTLGVPAEEAAGAVGEMVAVMEGRGLSCALKHFPGYGNNLNTHTGISVDERPYEQFQQQDFLPFQAGIASGASCVLVSHNIVTAMDPNRPASLSPAVHSVLRDELGFTGIILTDDLSMDAIKLYTDGQSPAVAAFLAGNDLLLTSDWEEDFHALLAAVQDGTVSEARVDESLSRILSWKMHKGLGVGES